MRSHEGMARFRLALGLFVVACAAQASDRPANAAKTAPPADTATRADAATQAGGDCLGSDSIVEIAPGHIGALRLDATLGAIQRQCPGFGWTTMHGDERVDTAILISRPGLRVVGSLAVIADEDGYEHPTLDSGMHVRYWEVTGTNARLPQGVPITATWADLRTSYGEVGANALNGIVDVLVCRMRGMIIQMSVPNPGSDSPINSVDGKQQPQSVLDSVMGNQRIDRVLVTPRPASVDTARCA
jgi:hypothetical protein